VLGALWWIIKFIFRKWRFTLAVLLLAALGYVGYRVKKVYFDGEGLFATTPAIDTTPEEIRALRNIGQWEALSVDTEELVEKNENSLLSSKQMVCVYRGTLRIGIDMAKVAEKWCNVQGKTVTLHLPDVELLDNEFINDTRTTVFVQEGNWNADAKQQMRTQAAEAMKKRALSAENNIVSSRVRIVRNFDNYLFPAKLGREDAKEIVKMSMDELGDLGKDGVLLKKYLHH